MSRAAPNMREDYAWFLPIQTRWADNDVYGHVNNSVYYFYFDTAVNAYLIGEDVLDPGKSETIGLVVETGCSYFAPVSFPDMIHAGIRVAKIGRSSVRYEVGIFKNDDLAASAQGHFVHVYVDAQTRRPAPLPAPLKFTLQKIEMTAT